MQWLKKTYHNREIKFKQIMLVWACAESGIPKRVVYVNLVTTRLRGRPRNRRQVEVGGDGKIVGGEGWQENVHNRTGRSS